MSLSITTKLRLSLFSVLFILLCSFTTEHTNSVTNKFVQFYVTDLGSHEESQVIDAAMRQEPGIIMSRADHNTGIYYCIFNDGYGIDESQFVQWFDDLGYQITCYREGVQGVDEVYSKETFICD